MVFLPGLAQIYQFCEIIQRALDLGWTEMLIPLPFHGQSSRETRFLHPLHFKSYGLCIVNQDSRGLA